jgi:hypothetical protein
MPGASSGHLIEPLAGEVARAQALPLLEPRRPRRGLLFFVATVIRRLSSAAITPLLQTSRSKPRGIGPNGNENPDRRLFKNQGTILSVYVRFSQASGTGTTQMFNVRLFSESIAH